MQNQRSKNLITEFGLLAILLIISAFNIVSAQEVPFFQWAKHTVSGVGDEYGNSITTDAVGNVFSTGEFTETADFDPGTSVFNLSPFAPGSRDIFISKLDANGNFVWAKSIGGGSLDAGTSIATDATGNVYITGYYGGPIDFDPGPGTFMMGPGGSYQNFILKLDADGNFVWAKNIDAEFSNAYITTHSSGFLYVTGYFEGSADFDPGPGSFVITIPNSLGNGDAYILKLDLDGNFVWARNLGDPSGPSRPKGISVGSSGEVVTVGNFQANADFDPGPGSFPLTSAGNFDVYISKLDANGDFVWANRIGGTFLDQAAGVGIDAAGNVSVGGFFAGTVDFDPGAATTNLTSAGSWDIFALQLNVSGNFNWAKRTGGTSDDQANVTYVDGAGSIYTTGYFRGTVDFDPGAAIANQTSAGNQDIFVQKLDAAGNFVWSTRTGSASTDIGNAIHSDAAGNVYLNSYFYQTADFDPTCGVANLSSTGSTDVFIQKLSVGFTPNIMSFTPGTGSAGTSVTLLGANFSATMTNNIVRFNGASATVTAATTTSVTALVPSGATTGVITLRVGCYTGASATSFTVGAASLPTITSFSPTSGSIGSSVTITGTNFNTTPANNTVQFNGITAVVTASTATSITTVVPAGATTGKITVTVASNTATSATDFTITTAPTPTIISFTPTSGPIGTNVTIIGTNFSTIPANNTVKFNGTTSVITGSTATSITTTVPAGTTTGKISLTVAGNTATSATDFTITTISNQPPVINATEATVPIAGSTSIDLTLLISDIDNNLDLTTLKIVNQPSSGALAQITNNVLSIDYIGLNFSGQDRITIEVCDLSSSCTQQELIIEVVGDLNIYTGISPNGDIYNEKWVIQNIELLPDTRENKVSIYNRWGDLVFEIENYDNDTRVFSGINKNGNEVSSGVYFYKIEFLSGKKPLLGYLNVKQ
ncbi:MAG: IPT/TIG domain-containing protein [Cyclobacteriaceae bacterium]|nr:IPT/TIG domain-containing protein [Cyclobacteriaceae bacterium]